MNYINHRISKFKGFLVISSSSRSFYRWENWGPLNVRWLPKVAQLTRQRPGTQFPCDRSNVPCDLTAPGFHMWSHRVLPHSSADTKHQIKAKKQVQSMSTLLLFLPTSLTPDLHTAYTNTKSPDIDHGIDFWVCVRRRDDVLKINKIC